MDGNETKKKTVYFKQKHSTKVIIYTKLSDMNYHLFFMFFFGWNFSLDFFFVCFNINLFFLFGNSEIPGKM